MSVYPFKAPFGYDTFKNKDGATVYRVRDEHGNALCRTYVEANAAIVVNAMNEYSRSKT